MSEAVKVQTDDATMTVNEVPVNLPERVEVVDSKSGKTIGYRDREEVMDLLEDDPYFRGVQPSNPNNDFIIAYDPDAMKAIECEVLDPFEFLNAIRDNLSTAIGADDPKGMLVGVSYVDRHKQNHVVSIRISRLRDGFDLMNQGLVAAMSTDRSEGIGQRGIGQRAVDWFIAQETEEPEDG